MSLIEILVAIGILTILSVSILEFYNTSQNLFYQQSQRIQDERVLIINQDFLTKGFFLSKNQNILNPLLLIPQKTETSISLLEPVEGLADIQVVSKKTEGELEVIVASGNRPTIYGKPIKTTSFPLNSPEVRGTGREYKVEEKIISNIFILPKSNPPGTYYTYTISDNEDEPTQYSSIWENPLFSPSNLPREIKIRAFHTDPYFSPSKTIAATFTLSKVIEINYKRENSKFGDKNMNLYGFTMDELKTNTNRIVLDTNFDAKFTALHYTINGEEPNLLSPCYTEPFHIPLESWNQEGVSLRVKPFVINNNVSYNESHLPEARYLLYPVKSQLPSPKLSVQNNQSMNKGETFNVIRNTLEGVTHVLVNNNLLTETTEDIVVAL